jgi:hypothetical protein
MVSVASSRKNVRTLRTVDRGPYARGATGVPHWQCGENLDFRALERDSGTFPPVRGTKMRKTSRRPMHCEMRSG